jgi:hypothetical protein
LYAPDFSAFELKYDEAHSNSAFDSNQRRYILGTVASGGEKARLMLAIKLAPAMKARAETEAEVAGDGYGRAVHVEPMTSVMKAPGSTLLKSICDGTLSNFALNITCAATARRCHRGGSTCPYRRGWRGGEGCRGRCQ